MCMREGETDNYPSRGLSSAVTDTQNEEMSWEKVLDMEEWY